MEPRFNYIALLIVIILGVTAGNLISAWLTNEDVETESNQASAEKSKSVVVKGKNVDAEQDSNDPVKPTIAANLEDQDQLMKQRKYDPDGSRLAKICNDWRKADEEMDTQTTKIESAKHCEIYEKYVRTGELPTTN